MSRKHDRATRQATHIYLAAAREVYRGWQQRQAHTIFNIKEQITLKRGC